MRPKPSMSDGPSVVFITNICPHYRVKTFEALSRHLRTVFYFFSAGDEWYWQQSHGTRQGNFKYEYLPGFQLWGTRITPRLISHLLFGEYDVMIKCITGRFALPVSYLIARLRGKPFVLWTGIWMTLQTCLHRWIFPLTRYIYRHSDAVVVYGEHVKRYLIEQGVPPDKVFVAHHAVDNAVYSRPVTGEEIEDLRSKYSIPKEAKLILYLGRLEDSKGLDYLTTAFAQMRQPQYVLMFVGEGSERSTIEAKSRELGIWEQVRFCNYVPPDQTPVYYASAQVLAVPSVTTGKTREPWGLVVNEAMNQGLAIVATESVGAAAGGLLRHKENGWVVPERDAMALAYALKTLLEDDELRARLGFSGRREIALWDNERMVQGFVRAVRSVYK